MSDPRSQRLPFIYGHEPWCDGRHIPFSTEGGRDCDSTLDRAEQERTVSLDADLMVELDRVLGDAEAAGIIGAKALRSALPSPNKGNWSRAALAQRDREPSYYEQFAAKAAEKMVERLDHGRGKFGTDWFISDYSDEDNIARCRRAVDHLEAALRNDAGPDEVWKRAADVANQAFMYADPRRNRGAALAQRDREETDGR